MNFLKAKNWIVIFFLSLFININFVSAKDLTGFIHTSNDTRIAYPNSINLFEETYNRSTFANILYSYGKDIGEYLNSYYGINDTIIFNGKYDYGISIMTLSDFDYVVSFSHDYKEFSSTDLDFSISGTDSVISYLFTDNNLNYDVYHDIVFKSGYSLQDLDKMIIINLSEAATGLTIMDDMASLSIAPRYIFMFNKLGEHIGYIDIGVLSTDCATYSKCNGYNSNFASRLKFDFPYDDVNPDMTSWYAYLYKGSGMSLLDSIDKAYPEFFFLEGSDEYVMVSNNAGYTGISGFFKELSSDAYELDYYNLDFVFEDVFASRGNKFESIYYRWFSSTTSVIPDNYSSIDVSDYKMGYYLVPISGCSDKDYMLYYSGVSNLSINSIYFSYYKFSASNNSLTLDKQFVAYSSDSYVNYSYNPLSDLNVNSSNFLNYSINVYLYSTRYSYNLYYNSSCYRSYIADYNYSDTLEFESGTYELSTSEVTNNYNNYQHNNSETIKPSTGTSNPNVENSTVSNSKIDGVINNINGYVAGIYDSVQSLVGIATVFLTGLPSDIYGLLFAVFAIGMIIFIIKLIK